MRKRLVLGLVALAGVLLVTAGLVAMRSGSTTPTATTAPAATIAPGFVAPGSLEYKPVKLSDRCTDAVAPLRAFMDDHTSGLTISEAADIDKMNTLRRAALPHCSVEEWTEFDRDEFRPWLNAKP